MPSNRQRKHVKPPASWPLSDCHCLTVRLSLHLSWNVIANIATDVRPTNALKEKPGVLCFAALRDKLIECVVHSYFFSSDIPAVGIGRVSLTYQGGHK
jgi:hypothetical protein